MRFARFLQKVTGALYDKLHAGRLGGADLTARVLTSCVTVSTSLDIMTKVPI